MFAPRGWVALAVGCSLVVTACAGDDQDALDQVSQGIGQPPINSLPPPQTTNEDSPLFFSDVGGNAITVSDADNATLTVQIIVTNGTFTLGHTSGLSVTGNGTFSVTASGTITALNFGIDNGFYRPDTDYNGAATLQMNSSDSNGESDLDILPITVTAFNDPPVDIVPSGVQAATEDVPRSFTLSITDVDVAGAPMLVTLTASNATLITLPTITGLTFTGGDGADDATMAFSGTLPDVNAALNGVVITPPLNYIGASTLNVTSNDQGATGAGVAGADNDTITLSWAAVNDAPVNGVPGAQSLAEDGSKTFSAANGNALTVGDVDATTALVQVTLTASTGVVTLGNPGLVAFSNGDGVADPTMTFNATLANLNAALDGTVYVPAASFSGSATLTMVSNDLGNVGAGGAKSDTDVVGLTVSAVNDPPINATPGAQITTEDSARVFSPGNGNTITVTDPDATSLEVTLTATTGTASLSGVAGLSFLAGDGTADVQMTFSGTIASINSALNGARFTPTANVSGPGSLAISTSDLGATGAGGPLQDDDTIAITITAVNDVPTALSDTATIAEDAGPTPVSVLGNDTAAPDTGETLTVTGVGTPLHGSASTDGTTVTYTPVADYNGTDSVGYTISDGNGGVASATLSLTITSVNDDPVAVDDAFSVVTDSSSNTLTVLTNDTVAPDIGETLTISNVGTPLHGTAVAISAATRISYTPAPGYSGPDSFTYTISDGNGGFDTATVTLNVVLVVTAPVNSLPGPQTLVEDSPLFFSSAAGNAITVSDSNNTTLTVQVLVTNGSFTLGTTTGVGPVGNGTSSLLMSGTIAALNTALNGSKYTPTADYFGPAQLTINTTDGGGGTESDIDTLTLTVTSFNDPPVNTVPAGSQTATEDSPRTFSTISVSDVDLEGADLRLTLTANNGTVITLASTDGLAFVSGDGVADATMTVTGTLPSLNVALNGLTISSPNNYIGPSTLVVTSNDQGHTGAGLVGTDTDTINLTWGAVNDPPINAVAGPQTINEETTLVFSSAGGTALTVSDGDVSAGTMQVQLTATSGTITLGDTGSVTFTAGDGLADTTMTFRATLATVNAAMNGTSYTPNTNFAGAATLTMVSNDLGNTGGAAQTDTDVVNLTVAGINDAPVLTAPGSSSTNEDIPRLFATAQGNPITITDPDATAVQVSIGATNGTISLATTSGLTFQAGDGTTDPTMTFTGLTASCNAALNGVRFNPAANFVGGGALEIAVSDLGGAGAGGPLTDETAISITVNPVNDAPDAVNDTPASIAEDSPPTVIAVLANDTSAPDLGETLTITGTSASTHGTVTFTASNVTYTPNADYFGADSFTYTVSDGNTGIDTATVSLTITAVNDLPNAVNDTFTVAESSTNNAFPVRANDTALPDTGETLTVTAVTTPAHGVATITGSGSSTAISYTPTPSYFGPDSLTYTLSDPSGAIDTAVVSITVTSVSTTPVAVNDTMSVGEDGIGIVDVLANDTGKGDVPITVLAALPSPLHGSITVLADQTIRYTPAADYHGADSFGYTIRDVDNDSDDGLVTVTVLSVDDMPVAVDDTATTDEDTSIVVVVLANDTKVVDLPAVVTVSTAAAHGTATVAGTSISYVPAADYAGTDTFDYRVTDADGDAAIAHVTMTITPVNDAPVAVDDFVASHLDEAIDTDVRLNDTDVDGDPLTVLSVTTPSSGAATINGDGTVHFVPAPGFTGTAMFSYTLSDGSALQDTGDVRVAVGVDTDGDGLLDVDELGLYGTDPLDADTDGDGIEDGDELQVAMTDPVDDDSDDDGLEDGGEDLDGDGPDPGETDANDVDTDADGVQDGTESGLDAPQGVDTDAGVFVADLDPASTTDPVVADTDEGGAIDGDEDLDGNGRIDEGETDPNDPSDDPGPPDTDGDGVADPDDNCPDDFNQNQADGDGDGVGDRCDDDNPREESGCCDTGGASPVGPAWLVLATVLVLRRRRRA